MTQYQHERSGAAPSILTRDNNSLENRVKSLSDRIEHQAAALREIERLIRRLQNEVRTAVNSLNLGRHG